MRVPGDPRPAPRWWPQEGDEPDPRWSLANERTFLAYLRTSLSFLVAGLAIAGSHQAFDAPISVAILGVPLIVIGTLLSLTSHGRFRAAQHAMRTGSPLPAPVNTRVLPWVVGVVGVATLVIAVVQLFV